MDEKAGAAHAEAGVIEALRRGDEAAFASLVDRHQASLRRMARLYCSNPAVADEVVQDTWVGVIQGIWGFEGRSSLKTWIFRILINRAKTRALREGRSVPFSDLSVGDDAEATEFVVDSDVLSKRHATEAGHWPGAPGDLGPSPETRLLEQEAAEQLRKAIDLLPPNQRLVLTLRDVEGFSAEEVCNALGIRETNQRVLLHRARSKVRAAAEPYLEGKRGS